MKFEFEIPDDSPFADPRKARAMLMRGYTHFRAAQEANEAKPDLDPLAPDYTHDPGNETPAAKQFFQMRKHLDKEEAAWKKLLTSFKCEGGL